MRPTRNIRETLIRKLFTHPRVTQQEAFLKARPTLFPSGTDFVAFLEADSTQEMVERAKSILLDLVFTSMCPPPSRLLLNLLSSQEFDKYSYAEGDYIPRDHFVHLVHLYLLGIYLFGHHEKVFHRSASELQRYRRAAKADNLNSYELFGVVWSQFVLFHDLGYPLERIKPSCRPEGSAWLGSFAKILKGPRPRCSASLHAERGLRAGGGGGDRPDPCSRARPAGGRHDQGRGR